MRTPNCDVIQNGELVRHDDYSPRARRLRAEWFAEADALIEDLREVMREMGIEPPPRYARKGAA